MITAYSFGASTAAGARDDEVGGFIARVGHYLADTDAGSSVNHGVGGDTTTMMLARLDAVAADIRGREGPLALVTLGINDVPRIVDDKPGIRVGLEQHVESLDRILSVLGDIGDVIYITQYPVDYVARSLEPSLVESYVKAGEATARAASVDVVDVFSMVDTNRFKEFIFEDGLHFNPRGHQFMANALIAALHSTGRLG
jgi:lysophospholipase L1-like esterase